MNDRVSAFFGTVLLMIAICTVVQFMLATRVAGESDPFVDFRGQAPGKMHKIMPGDLPKPYASRSVDHGPEIVPRPANFLPKAPPGFQVGLFASGLQNPRLLRTAPNGDVFLSESAVGRIRVFRGTGKDGRYESMVVFAQGLRKPFGIAFYPPGPDPRYVYVANTDSIVRFAYKSGDLKAGARETVIANLPAGGHLRGGGHWTRDIAFSPDGKKLYVSVGSFSNVADTDKDPVEYHRANILVSNPDGSDLRIYASGIRNAVGIAVHPQTGDLWASVNERDGLGDNLPPDYITRIQDGGFYGWPWYYIGGNPDPRLGGKHPELRQKSVIPDVLIQPHAASLEMVFYQATAFPEEYRGNIFAAEHGSWNRRSPAGYEVIRVPVKDGRAGGEYVDFLTGFITDSGKVWGRPVGITVAADGSLLVSDDGSNSIWRVSYQKK